jgi:hypothetical protein
MVRRTAPRYVVFLPRLYTAMLSRYEWFGAKRRAAYGKSTLAACLPAPAAETAAAPA